MGSVWHEAFKKYITNYISNACKWFTCGTKSPSLKTQKVKVCDYLIIYSNSSIVIKKAPQCGSCSRWKGGTMHANATHIFFSCSPSGLIYIWWDYTFKKENGTLVSLVIPLRMKALSLFALKDPDLLKQELSQHAEVQGFLGEWVWHIWSRFALIYEYYTVCLSNSSEDV